MPQEITRTLALTALLLTGCVTSPVVSPATPAAPVLYRSPDHTLRVVRHGNLLDLFEPRKKNATLADFLYGPEERSPWIRTPQGLDASAGTLFVSDQSIPDVLRVDLKTGEVSAGTRSVDRPACPVAVAAIGERLFVADTTRNRVLVYDSEGRLGEALVPPGASPETFHPTALLAHEGVLFIADTHSRGIHRFQTASRTWLPAIRYGGDKAPLGAPTGLAMTPGGTLLISDALLGVVHRVDPDGDGRPPLGSRGRRPGQFIRPIGVCVMASGVVVVADAARQVIAIFHEDGEFALELGGSSSPWAMPCGVAVVDGPVADRSGEWVIVSDTLGSTGLVLLEVTHHRAEEN